MKKGIIFFTILFTLNFCFSQKQEDSTLIKNALGALDSRPNPYTFSEDEAKKILSGEIKQSRKFCYNNPSYGDNYLKRKIEKGREIYRINIDEKKNVKWVIERKITSLIDWGTNWALLFNIILGIMMIIFILMSSKIYKKIGMGSLILIPMIIIIISIIIDLLFDGIITYFFFVIGIYIITSLCFVISKI